MPRKVLGISYSIYTSFMNKLIYLKNSLQCCCYVIFRQIKGESSESMLSKKKIMWARDIILDVLAATLKKVKNKWKWFNNLFYLTQYIQKLTIQHVIIIKILLTQVSYILCLHTRFLKSGVYLTYTAHLSLDQPHSCSYMWPVAAAGDSADLGRFLWAISVKASVNMLASSATLLCLWITPGALEKVTQANSEYICGGGHVPVVSDL